MARDEIVMQYYEPGAGTFVGDCMPFFHDGVFHLYYLLDEGHHGALGGLGGHQWAHASSRDLVTWRQHPMALSLTEPYEASICTGSVFYHDGLYHAFYATRLRDWREYISLATSRDGVCFEKIKDGVEVERPQAYSPVHFRDPFVFRSDETDQFHMLVTAQRLGERRLERGGCVARFVSHDLRRWTEQEPLLAPGYLDRPECPDYFHWNGWTYLLFSIDSHTHYRLSRHPFGPWQRPAVDTLDGLMLHVLRSAPYRNGRRLAAGYLAPRHAPGETGKLPYAGSAVFRELVQHKDGRLGTRFPPEMTPGSRAALLDLPFRALSDGVRRRQDGTIEVTAWEGFGAGALSGVPHNAHIRLRLEPEPGSNYYGLGLRGSGRFEDGFELRLSPHEQTVEVRHTQDATYVRDEYHTLHGVVDLDKPLALEVVMKDDVIDVCVDDRRCLVGRFERKDGNRLFFFSQMGAVRFGSVEIREIGA